MLRSALVALLISLGLAACGETRLERGATGAGIGAAAGAAASGITGATFWAAPCSAAPRPGRWRVSFAQARAPRSRRNDAGHRRVRSAHDRARGALA